MEENKQEIITRLKLLLQATRAGADIKHLYINSEQTTVIINSEQTTVIIQFENDDMKEVIEGDSGIAIIQDVIKALY